MMPDISRRFDELAKLWECPLCGRWADGGAYTVRGGYRVLVCDSCAPMPEAGYDLTRGGGWIYARCAKCTKAGKYPGAIDRAWTADHCAVCQVVIAELSDARAKASTRTLEARRTHRDDLAAMAATTAAIKAEMEEAEMLTPVITCGHCTYRSAGASACPACKWPLDDGTSAVAAELKAVAHDRADAGAYVTGPDGKQYRVPDHDALAAKVRARESKLAGDILDRLDSEHPYHAVVLPPALQAMAFHADWAAARRAYITGTGSAADLAAQFDLMKQFVTMDNPPLAADVMPTASASTPVCYQRPGDHTSTPIRYRLGFGGPIVALQPALSQMWIRGMVTGFVLATVIWGVLTALGLIGR